MVSLRGMSSRCAAHQWGGLSPKASVYNLLMQFFSLGSSKSKFPNLFF